MNSPFAQAEDFTVHLQRELLAFLPRSFQVLRSKSPIRRARAGGHDIAMLSHRPTDRAEEGEFAFSFTPGRSYVIALRVQKLMGASGTHAQITQLPERLRGLGGIPPQQPYEWCANVYEAPTQTARALAEAVPVLAEPFWQRFTTPLSARDALVREDPWCSGGHMRWANVLLLDLALGDKKRFRAWSGSLSEPIKQQAEYLIGLYERANSDAT